MLLLNVWDCWWHSTAIDIVYIATTESDKSCGDANLNAVWLFSEVLTCRWMSRLMRVSFCWALTFTSAPTVVSTVGSAWGASRSMALRQCWNWRSLQSCATASPPVNQTDHTASHHTKSPLHPLRCLLITSIFSMLCSLHLCRSRQQNWVIFKILQWVHHEDPTTPEMCCYTTLWNTNVHC